MSEKASEQKSSQELIELIKDKRTFRMQIEITTINSYLENLERSLQQWIALHFMF